MAKKKTQSSNLLGDTKRNTAIPTQKETTKAVQGLTKKTSPKNKFSLEDAKKEDSKQGVNDYESRDGRIRYTSVMNKNIKKNLQKIAKNKGVSIADIIEECITTYFGEGIKDK